MQNPGSGNVGGLSIIRNADAAEKSWEAQEASYLKEIEDLRMVNKELEKNIKKIRSYNDMDQYMGSEKPTQRAMTTMNEGGFGTGTYGSEKLANNMAESEARVREVYDRETREMAEAAQATIKTLNEMLDQKKKQLDTKEQHIAGLRQSMAEDRKKHVESMLRLERQLSEANRRNMEAASRMSTEPTGKAQ
jgi:cell division septum initiation protein DivIVA